MKKIIIFSFLILGGCLLTRQEVAEREQGKVIQDQMVNLQKNTAEQQMKFSDFSEDMRNLSGRIEVLENQLKILETEKQKNIKSESDHIEELSRKVSLLQEEIGKLTVIVSGLNNDIATLKTPTTSGSNKSNPFDEAEQNFSKQDWKKAIFNFQKYRDENPKGKKFSEATYKIGVSFQELGMKDEAKAFYEEVINKFPQSSMANKAKIRLKKL